MIDTTAEERKVDNDLMFARFFIESDDGNVVGVFHVKGEIGKVFDVLLSAKNFFLHYKTPSTSPNRLQLALPSAFNQISEDSPHT
jgi:hypothetical protein